MSSCVPDVLVDEMRLSKEKRCSVGARSLLLSHRCSCASLLLWTTLFFLFLGRSCAFLVANPASNSLVDFAASFHCSSPPSFGRLSCLEQTSSPQDDDSPSETRSSDSLQNADSRRRRQLLFSMLATSSVASSLGVVGTPAASAKVSSKVIKSPSINILRPPLDDRDYETYELDNGLRVLLCSDQSTNEAACAMDVHVGACSDPPQVPGLAHFNEHMLFLGTKQYPEEESFSSFLSTNGGSSNAFTDSENTVYYFDMEAEEESKFSEGLLRFGSFFTSPLFTESATGRELNAIESENAKNLQNDIFRMYQIEKSRANQEHPYSKFFTGNKKTLLEDTKRQGIDLREQLIQFYNRYYSANQMTLAVVAPQSIPELKKIVSKAFGEVPNRNVPKPELAWAGVPPFFNGNSLIPSFQHVVEIVPVQDLRQVTLSWPLVYASEKDRQESMLTKPVEYVSHLIGHEGPGSLLSYLKRQGWANLLGSARNADLTDFESFEVTVDLTNKGLEAVDKVSEAVFSYISMLRDETIPNYVLEEVLQLDELDWRFLTKSSPANYVQSLVTAMQQYPPSFYVAGPRRLALVDSTSTLLESSAPRSSFSSDAQRDLAKDASYSLISKLTVDNVIVTILSKTFEKQANQVEKWYGTKYRVKAIPQSTLGQWRNCVSPLELGLAFPQPNVFIPSEEGLRVKKRPAVVNKFKKRTFESRMQPVTPPKLIRDDGEEGRWTVYFKQDDKFGQPKAYIVFQLMTNEVFASSTSAVLAQLYQTCAADHLEEYAYDARLAGLTYDVQVLPRGVRLTFGGYNDKLQDFALYVTQKLARDIDTILPQYDVDFDRYKDQIMRALSAFDVKQPYSHAIYYSGLTLQPRLYQYTNKQLRDAIRKTTRTELIYYAKSLWSSGKGEALVQGNLDQNEAQDLVNAIDDVISFRTISASEYPPRLKALKLPPTAAGSMPTRLSISEPNPSNGNSATQVVLQSLGKTEKDHVLIELISSILSEPLYEDLRTKQQLGYIVSSGLKAPDSRTRSLALIVQSSVVPVGKLTTEILKFLDSFKQKSLEPLNKGDLAMYVKGLIDRKTEPEKTLATEVTRNWSEIANGRLQFDRIQKEAAALLDVTKDDLLEFWDTIYAGDTRRILVTEIVPRTGPASSAAPPTSTGYVRRAISDIEPTGGIKLGIDDIERFRRDREERGTEVSKA